MGGTSKITLRTVEEFMAGYQPIYQPLYPLFMGKSQAYADEVGKITFKRATAVGDLRAKHFLPKQTEIQQIAVGEASRTFKKYFLATQFQQSELQEAQDIEGVIAQVLEEHQKHADDLLLLGEGTSAGTVINNGLFWSGDANYTLNNSVEVKKGTATDYLADMHSKIVSTCATADALAGKKALIVYGTTATGRFDAVYSTAPVPFKRTLSEVLTGYSLIKLPAAVTPAAANGWIVVNLDQVKLHHCTLPALKNQGVNEEKMYSWHNFLMGSMMLEVLASGAVNRQPVTFEA